MNMFCIRECIFFTAVKLHLIRLCYPDDSTTKTTVLCLHRYCVHPQCSHATHMHNVVMLRTMYIHKHVLCPVVGRCGENKKCERNSSAP